MKRQLLKFILAIAAAIAVLQLTRAGRAAEQAPIQLTPDRRQLIGVTFTTVERREVARRIDTTANLEGDEQLQSYVQTRFSGWIQQAFVNQTFQHVRRGQALFTVYSPDLVSTEQEYVLAIHARDRVADSTVEDVAEGASSLARAAAERLSLLGIPQSEISRLAQGGRPRNVLTIYSPASGFVVVRAAFPNMFVQPETRLYTIADLSTVWAYAAVFQDELGGIRAGDSASLTVDTYPGESFVGRVEYIWPQIDKATRTARIRVAFKNRSLKLKPGMYGRITLQIKIGERIVIPAGGVLRTGIHNVAFIDRGGGYLAPAYVELGPRVGNDLVVLKGLAPGQRIVASANFLIDSESQLQAATGSFAPQPSDVSASAAQRSEQKPVAALEVLTIPNPPTRGKNQVRVILKDPQGHGIDGAKLSVSFYMAAMPAMGMSAMRSAVTLSDRGGGIYEGDLTLESGGTWQVTAVAIKEGRTLATRQFNKSATGGM